MSKYEGLGKPTRVSRDGGYSKIKSISAENRRKIKERIENSEKLVGKYKIREIYAKRGIVVNPEAMTMMYSVTK